jgi:hypothetical protein
MVSTEPQFGPNVDLAIFKTAIEDDDEDVGAWNRKGHK